ncbi:hypothetical protein [Croceimicrobium hydrocarbonivorans]|uniref:Uncharacterized protein n=1 Tax=Croceimicrobium hydrocarbonivorans TaxID=2761580 RepID=A0A7H0VFU5_9FLAO|nr:hypothetical protein [Croceimicrobium hydrocarbonivorans]QNR24593.1 hypothetical protein H4K34_01760 [Croceimicrobium hydrocarbonivorans]
MRTMNIDLQKLDWKAADFKRLISLAIDQQIKDIRSEFLRRWEADHQLTGADQEAKIQDLKNLKTQVLSELKEVSDDAALKAIALAADAPKQGTWSPNFEMAGQEN